MWQFLKDCREIWSDAAAKIRWRKKSSRQFYKALAELPVPHTGVNQVKENGGCMNVAEARVVKALDK